jgi:hypothetical protein
MGSWFITMRQDAKLGKSGPAGMIIATTLFGPLAAAYRQLLRR